MRGLWLENNALSVRDNIPLPRLSTGEARVRVNLAGVCATDVELVNGYYPFRGVLGHEFVGEIVSAPDAPHRHGERVVGEINVACGACAQCLEGRAGHCENRGVLGIKERNGAFAEFLHLPLNNLIPVPDGVPDEAAVFTEPLAAALEIQEQVPITPGQRVLVIGAGRLGQLIAQTLSKTCQLSVVARHPKQRKLLKNRGIDWLAEDAVSKRRYDLVVESTGSSGGFALARNAVRPRGTIVLKSTYKGDLEVNFSSLVVDEITLVGSRCGPFHKALRLLEAGAIDPLPLIEHRLPLVDAVNALEIADRPGVLKVLLEICNNQDNQQCGGKVCG